MWKRERQVPKQVLIDTAQQKIREIQAVSIKHFVWDLSADVWTPSSPSPASRFLQQNTGHDPRTGADSITGHDTVFVEGIRQVRVRSVRTRVNEEAAEKGPQLVHVVSRCCARGSLFQ